LLVWPQSCRIGFGSLRRDLGYQAFAVPLEDSELSRNNALGGDLVVSPQLGSATMNDRKETLPEAAWNHAELLERVDNDQDLLRELLIIFKEDFPRTMQSLESAVAGGDLKNTARLGHTLKGMLSSLGAARAAKAASKLEDMAFAGETVSLRGAFDALACQTASLLPEIDAYMTEVHH
jgi:HPt (histidine-containing phosphotransfer) domain-containing protein